MQRGDLDLQVLHRTSLFTIDVPESQSSLYADAVFFFLAPVQHGRACHAPIRICTPHTHVQGAQPMGVTQHKDIKAKLLQRHAHLCKLKQLCLCYITAQSHVVIVMRLTVQHYRSIYLVNID